MFKRLRSAARLAYRHLTGRPMSLAETFDLLFVALPDPWGFRRSPLERERYDRLLRTLEGRRFERALEVGCAEGLFTRRLAEIADHVVGLDVSKVALERAQAACQDLGARVTFEAHDLTAGPPPQSGFDLIVASEVLYFLEDPQVLRQVAQHLVQSCAPGGWLLLAHMRLLKDDTSGHARTFSGYPRIGAATVHAVFHQLAELTVVRQDLQAKYAICLFERRA